MLIAGVAATALFVWWFVFSDEFSDAEILGAAVQPDAVHLTVSACGFHAYQVEIDDREDGIDFRHA